MARLGSQHGQSMEISENFDDNATIILSSEDDSTDELQVNEVYGELIQENKLKGIISKFLVVNMYYVFIQEQGKFSSRKYWINLGNLKYKPKRCLYFTWRWLVIAALFALILVSAYKYIPASNLPNKDFTLTSILTGCTLVVALSLWVFFHQIRYRHVYYSRTGKAPFLELIPNRPNRDKYQRFKEVMQEHMRLACNKGVIPGDALARELREHRRLNQSGIISNTQYVRAKAFILRGHSQSKAR